MKYYIELTLLPNEEIPIYFLWEKLYQQLHIALVKIKQPDNSIVIGTSFPDFDEKMNHLGCRFRLFAKEKEALEILSTTNWLSRLKDYLLITDILDVPEKIDSYVCFKRNQPKSNNARLARRMAKRKDISYEQALSHYESRLVQMTKLPYINMKSHSSDNKFRLFIEKSDGENQVEGAFNSYGLSKTATVPWF